MKRRSSSDIRRTRWTTSDAAKVLAEFEASGKSMTEFGRERGLHPMRLSRWQKRLGRTTGSVGLVPVTINGATSIRVGSCGLVVETSSARLEVHDVDPATAAWVAEFVRLTEARR